MGPAAAEGRRVGAFIRHGRHDPSARPFLVIWELTRACDLACRHCRAEACPAAAPDELTTEEGLRLIDQVAAFGRPYPLFVMTGGDPFKRADLLDLARGASRAGLSVSIAPSATPLLHTGSLRSLRDAGVVALSLSLDGSTAELHDGFRQVAGVFDRTIACWRAAREIGLKVQINTTVARHNLEDLPEVFRLVRALGAMTWSVFFLVPTGRGQSLPQLSAAEAEDVLHFLYDAAKAVPLKTTEAPHFRRVAIQRAILERRQLDPVGALGLGELYRRLRARLSEAEPGFDFDAPARMRRAPLDVNAGRGFAFISHSGAVCPSGFLPLAGGSVRDRPLPEIYRDSPLFRRLRDPDALRGRCGGCEFREVCGGSRSRAYAVSGDVLSEEPWCAYEPGSFGCRPEILELMGGSEPDRAGCDARRNGDGDGHGR